MICISKAEIEFLKKISNIQDFIEIEKLLKNGIDTNIVEILRRYCKENTMNLKPDVTIQLRSAGITEDDGKYMLSNLRRLGIKSLNPIKSIYYLIKS